MDRAFRNRVDAALVEARKILATTRSIVLPPDAAHDYTDKFLLADRAANTLIAAMVSGLEEGTSGCWGEHFPQLQAWAAAGKEVTLRFSSNSVCKFVRTATRNETSPTVVRSASSRLFGRSKATTTVVTVVTEHFWNAVHTWQLVAYAGIDPDVDRVVLCENVATCELKTRGGSGLRSAGGTQCCPAAHSLAMFATPHQGYLCDSCDAIQAGAATMHGCRPCDYDVCALCFAPSQPTTPPPHRGGAHTSEVSLSWLLAQLAEGGEAFAIDRGAASCRTPKVNDEIAALETWARSALHFWSALARVGNDAMARSVFMHPLSPLTTIAHLDAQPDAHRLDACVARIGAELFDVGAAAFSLDGTGGDAGGDDDYAAFVAHFRGEFYLPLHCTRIMLTI